LRLQQQQRGNVPEQAELMSNESWQQRQVSLSSLYQGTSALFTIISSTRFHSPRLMYLCSENHRVPANILWKQRLCKKIKIIKIIIILTSKGDILVSLSN
jgi:hypothetical protein